MEGSTLSATRGLYAHSQASAAGFPERMETHGCMPVDAERRRRGRRRRPFHEASGRVPLRLAGRRRRTTWPLRARGCSEHIHGAPPTFTRSSTTFGDSSDRTGSSPDAQRCRLRHRAAIPVRPEPRSRREAGSGTAVSSVCTFSEARKARFCPNTATLSEAPTAIKFTPGRRDPVMNRCLGTFSAIPSDAGPHSQLVPHFVEQAMNT